MDPLLLDYYNKELIYLKEMGAEFAQQHPKIASRLGMKGLEVADPYVERLLEGFAFLAARTQIKLDAEFPRFTQRLLEVIYPNYLSPTPSMTVVQINPKTSEGDLSKGFSVPRGTQFYNRVRGESDTEVVFTTSQNVELWPLSIKSAQLTGAPPDIINLERYIPPTQTVKGALRLVIQLEGEQTFDKLANLDRLPIYLSGDERIASQLFELIHAHSVSTIVCAPGEVNTQSNTTQPGVELEGFEPEQSLLPLHWHTFHGHNLIHEYFANPTRFYFFALTGLSQGLQKIKGKRAEIIVLLNETSNELIAHVNNEQFSLFCTPAINLFEKQADRVEVNLKQTEFHLVMNRQRPLDYEIYKVTEVLGQESDSSENTLFRPLFETLNQDDGNYGKYFSINREMRLVSDSIRKYGTRTQYIGSEVFVNLVDQFEAPYSDNIRYLSVTAEVTNRDLAILLPRNGKRDLLCKLSIPSKEIGIIRPISPTRAPFALRERAWRLIRQLSFNYLPLSELDGRAGGQALRDLLKLFVAHQDENAKQQINALLGSEVKAVNRRLPGKGPIVYGRGIEFELSIDEQGFSGNSPFLFGLILEHFITKHVSINMFTQASLTSLQRGHIHRFAPRMGRRTAV